MNGYRAPGWLPGGNLQTIWPALVSPPPSRVLPAYTRERWDTPDGDFVDVDFQAGQPGQPALVLFHGLESSSTSHYALAFAHAARQRGWAFTVPHFRGCSGELNRGPRAYHSGDFEEVGWILQRLRQHHGQPLLVAGVSLGGNALLRWAEEAGDSASAIASAVAAVSAPVDLAAAGRAAPLLVLFHGLEGSSRSHYALAFAHRAAQLGWSYAVPHFRGCSGEINRAPRAYHSGDYEEIGWMLGRLRARHERPLAAVGVSLGGNALLRWAEEAGDSAAATACAVAAICSPVDLAAGGMAIGRGFNRQVYTRMFLRSMKPKALAKWDQHPGLFDRERLKAARTLYEFDDVFTAPLHGFSGTLDYWARASAAPQLARVRLPTLVLNARNDPFVPGDALPRAPEVGAWVTLWQPDHGGHVGFPGGRFPGHLMTLPEAVLDWLAKPH